ncbi:unnamed protein product [Laminaria digitata]
MFSDLTLGSLTQYCLNLVFFFFFSPPKIFSFIPIYEPWDCVVGLRRTWYAFSQFNPFLDEVWSSSSEERNLENIRRTTTVALININHYYRNRFLFFICCCYCPAPTWGARAMNDCPAPTGGARAMNVRHENTYLA